MYSIITREYTYNTHLKAIERFTVINGNQLVEYSSIQNRDQIIEELFSGIPQNGCSESTCSGIILEKLQFVIPNFIKIGPQH